MRPGGGDGLANDFHPLTRPVNVQLWDNYTFQHSVE